MIDSDITERMTDNGDRTYSSTFTFHRPGYITLTVIKYTQSRVYGEYYLSRNHEGRSYYWNTANNINFNWGYSRVFYYRGSRYDNVSAKYYFRLLAPVTGQYNFTVDVDDEMRMYLDGNLIMNHTSGVHTDSVILVAGTYYYGKIEYEEGYSRAELMLYWAYDGQTQEIIPSTNFFGPTYVRTPTNYYIYCPSGYSVVTINGRPE